MAINRGFSRSRRRKRYLSDVSSNKVIEFQYDGTITSNGSIAGDSVVIENGAFNIANPSFTLDIKRAIQSVKKIRKLNASRIICYHGGIMLEDIDAKLEQLIARYKEYV